MQEGWSEGIYSCVVAGTRRRMDVGEIRVPGGRTVVQWEGPAWKYLSSIRSQYWNYFTFAKFRNVGTTPSATIKGYSWLSCVQKSNSREINYFYTTFFYTFCKQKLSPVILCVARQHVWGLCFKTSSGSQYWNYFTFVQSSWKLLFFINKNRNPIWDPISAFWA